MKLPTGHPLTFSPCRLLSDGLCRYTSRFLQTLSSRLLQTSLATNQRRGDASQISGCSFLNVQIHRRSFRICGCALQYPDGRALTLTRRARCQESGAGVLLMAAGLHIEARAEWTLQANPAPPECEAGYDALLKNAQNKNK